MSIKRNMRKDGVAAGADVAVPAIISADVFAD